MNLHADVDRAAFRPGFEEEARTERGVRRRPGMLKETIQN